MEEIEEKILETKNPDEILPRDHILIFNAYNPFIDEQPNLAENN